MTKKRFKPRGGRQRRPIRPGGRPRQGTRPKQSVYPWVTRDEAKMWASTHLNCYFEVHEWPTVDPHRASQFTRALRLEQTGDLTGSLQRMKRRPEVKEEF